MYPVYMRKNRKMDKKGDIRRLIAYAKGCYGKEILPKEEEDHLWEQIGQVNAAARRRKRRRIIGFAATAAAAAVVLFFLFRQAEHSPLAMPETDYLSILAPAAREASKTDKIRIVLSDDEQLSIEGKESEISYDQDDILVNKEKLDISKASELNQLIVPPGKRSSLVLSDGTLMWVNSDTRVIFPARFTGNKREIFVDGEVFLEVNPSRDIPFIVKTKEMDIIVLGTQFNISTFPASGSSEVVLVSGSVEVKTKDHTKSLLKPNELFSYDKTTQTSNIKRVDVIDYIAWKDGYYRFNGETLRNVLEKVSRYYGIQVQWTQEVARLTCIGKLDLRDDPAEVFALLRHAAPIIVEENDGLYFVKLKKKKGT